MGFTYNGIYCHKIQHFAISLLIIVISTSSQLRLFNVEGRKLAQTTDNSETVNEEEKAILRAQIGSRPPRCERRCISCGHCEAIQVPTNPQVRTRPRNNSAGAISNIAYARGDDNSNYKPMSWKCKCGNLIFNP